MPANVGKLNIIVGAVSTPLKAGLKTASASVSGFASKVGAGVGKIRSTIASTIAPLATAIGAGGFTAGFVKASSAIDDVAKKADSLGIATEDLVSLRHAGELAGVGAEELDVGLGKMLKTIGGAQAGSDEATKAIEALGLSVSDLDGLTTTQQFGLIADAINSFQNPALRAAAATEIFGRGFLQLMPLLMGGSAGINTATAEAERLGLTFNRLDAAKVEGMNDAFTRLSESVGGVFQKIAIELAPTLDSAFNSGALAVSDLGSAIATFVNDAVNNILFFAGTWNKQWQLMKLNAQLALEEAQPISAFAARQRLGPSDTQIKRDVLLRDITAEREQWERLRDARAHPAKDESAFFKDFKSVTEALDESAFFGPNASSVSIMLGRSVKSLEKATDESIFFQDQPVAAAFGTSGQLATAAELGSSEASSAINASIAARAGTDDSIARNTLDTATNTGRIADAVENLEMPEFQVVESFS